MSQQSGLFGRTRSFASPGPAARRVAVIDVGSNSVRLVIFDGNARSPAYFFNEKVLCGLGKGVVAGGRLNPEARARALATLRRFAALAERMRVSALEAVATAAVRMAADGADFLEEVARETGIRVRVASGEDEARLSAQGVLLGNPGASGLVVDIGGASMELARIEAGAVRGGVSTPLGPLALRDTGRVGTALGRHIAAHLAGAVTAVGAGRGTVFLVGGAWRALGRVHMARAGYPLTVLHDYHMTPETLAEAARWVIRQTPSALVERAGIPPARADLLGLNAKVLLGLLEAAAPETVVLSSYGLREGLLWEKMTPRARARDPLIEACRFLEAGRARFPGFGAELFAWMQPMLGELSPEALRLARAACLLHDVNWRGHPDYRAEMGFETLIRASIGGISHRGRVYLGLALFHRYRSGGVGKLPQKLLGLLDPADRAEAERLGRALRLGAMISGSAPGALGSAPVALEAGALVLTLEGAMGELAGEVLDKRLAALAKAFGRAPGLRLPG